VFSNAKLLPLVERLIHSGLWLDTAAKWLRTLAFSLYAVLSDWVRCWENENKHMLLLLPLLALWCLLSVLCYTSHLRAIIFLLPIQWLLMPMGCRLGRRSQSESNSNKGSSECTKSLLYFYFFSFLLLLLLVLGFVLWVCGQNWVSK